MIPACLNCDLQGTSHKLEVNQPRIEDLSTDEEDRVHDQMRGYEKKIDSLMNEVGSLKNEVIDQSWWYRLYLHLFMYEYEYVFVP